MDWVYGEWGLILLQQEGAVGIVAGSALTLVGAWMNNHFATKTQQQQWAREDRTRKEEQEQKVRDERLQNRVRAYKTFFATTPLEAVSPSDRWELLSTLDEAFLEVWMYASEEVQGAAEGLYGYSRGIILRPEDEDDKDLQERLFALRAARKAFLNAVREEALREAKNQRSPYSVGS